MPQLTYTVEIPDPSRNSAAVLTSTTRDISDAQWFNLASAISKEKVLFQTPAHVLKQRWIHGEAAIAINDEKIISYIGSSQLLSAEAITILEASGISWSASFDVDVWELATGWTDWHWRKNRISQTLRRQLLIHFPHPGPIVWFSTAVGMGGGKALARLGWTQIGWKYFPYINSLVGFYFEHGFYISRMSRQEFLSSDKTPYMGSFLSALIKTNYAWEKHYHLWIKDYSLTNAVDEEIRLLLNNDLHYWQQTLSRFPNLSLP
jgi:hypothetical protein